MSDTRVCAAISFSGQDPEASDDPAEAMGDVLTLLAQLGCEQIDFTLLVTADDLTIHLVADFGPGGAGKPDLLRLALVRAEGEAGFVTSLQHEPPGAAGWMLASPYLDQAGLPSGEPFVLPLPLMDELGAVLRRLRLAGDAYGYRLSARREPAARDLARGLAPALAACETRGGPTALLAAALREAIDLVCQPGWSVLEGLCLPLDAADSFAELVEAQAVDSARRRAPTIPEEMFGVAWRPLDEIPAPPSAQDGWRPAISARRTTGYPARAIQAALEAARRESDTSRRPPPASPAPPATPKPPLPGGPFIFISYAHAERGKIQGVLDALERSGLPLWIDDLIHGGAQWDSHLESHIRDCALLLAFVSNAYEASRYCRRELKFADLLQKPILPVTLDGYSWGVGLTLMFQELQIVQLRDGRAGEAVERHVGQLVPALATRR